MMSFRSPGTDIDCHVIAQPRDEGVTEKYFLIWKYIAEAGEEAMCASIIEYLCAVCEM